MGIVDNVNKPAHYTAGGIESIEYMRSKMTPEQFEGFLMGNVLKYISRYPMKNGLEDLEKARWYLDRLIAQYLQFTIGKEESPQA